ncbi:MAG: NifU family protein [candidate division KSB1 bacterium]|nr:NifU family protein [candidate division KSB1 bacterium]MDZ7346707.1 NifU family protein [candidate division KSB1 bacterium]
MNPTFDQVEAVLDMIRPALMADGGNVELVDVTDGIVKLRLQGACHGCPMSQMTLRMGIERELRRHLPGIQQVISI